MEQFVAFAKEAKMGRRWRHHPSHLFCEIGSVKDELMEKCKGVFFGVVCVSPKAPEEPGAHQFELILQDHSPP